MLNYVKLVLLSLVLVISISYTYSSSSNDDSCGRLYVNPSFVNGGVESIDAPWVVSIGAHTGANSAYVHICTGSVISKTHILTAGHCCLEIKPKM